MFAREERDAFFRPAVAVTPHVANGTAAVGGHPQEQAIERLTVNAHLSENVRLLKQRIVAGLPRQQALCGRTVKRTRHHVLKQR